MKTRKPVEVAVHVPEGEAGRQALAGRVAGAHAEAVFGVMDNLDCPAGEKLALLQAVLDAVQASGRQS